MEALQLGNSVGGSSDSVDTGRRGFMQFLSVAGVTTMVAATTGCVTLLEKKDVRAVLKQMLLAKKININKKTEDMSPFIEISKDPDSSGNYSIEHKKIGLITKSQLKFSAQGELITKRIQADSIELEHNIIVAIGARISHGIEFGDILEATEKNGIIYIENISSKNRKVESVAQNESDPK